MRFKLTLKSLHYPALLPFNYQYPLSSAIYRIIQTADAEFAAFLHSTGYRQEGKSFKLFTFSDIRTPFVRIKDRIQLVTGEAELIVCFYLPQAAEHFIRGLFINQRLEVADQFSKTVFDVVGVESISSEVVGSGRIVLQPLSPIVVGRRNERGHYDYLNPEDTRFTECLYYNWMEKCAAVGLPVRIGDEEPDVRIDVLSFHHPAQQR
jgi:CRISPR-associated endoribonuclease Cas6